MLKTNQKNNLFRDAFRKSLNDCRDLFIASGYFGKSELDKQTSILIDIAARGGTVKLIHGLAMSEGVARNLNNTLISINNTLKHYSENNGVYIFKDRYHGKLYIIDGDENSKVYIGSSNFSRSGFENNIELNIEVSDDNTILHSKSFFDDLFNLSIPISLSDHPIKGERSRVQTTHDETNNFEFVINREHDFEIPLRVQPRSSLNLHLSKGRLNKNTGIYAPRPFFEVEITIPKRFWTPPLTTFITDSTVPVEFTIHTDTQVSFNGLFKRKTSSNLDTRTLHNTGGDFMSSPRDQLGHYIKEKLIKAEILKFGEPITEDTLSEYGSDSLKVWKIDNDNLYIKF